MDKTAEGQNKILHQVVLFKQEQHCGPDFNFLHIHFSHHKSKCLSLQQPASLRIETPFLGLEDYEREDVTFEIFIFVHNKRLSSSGMQQGKPDAMCSRADQILWQLDAQVKS